MRGECKFFRVRGVHFFAQVEVEAQAKPSRPDLVTEGIGSLNEGAGEASSRTAPSWAKAALEGISAALQQLRERRPSCGWWDVRLTRLVVSNTDTRADVARCAAMAATWNAIAPDAHADFEFTGDEWVAYLK